MAPGLPGWLAAKVPFVPMPAAGPIAGGDGIVKDPKGSYVTIIGTSESVLTLDCPAGPGMGRGGRCGARLLLP